MKKSFSRRLLTVLLVAALCLCVMPFFASAVEETVELDFTNNDYWGLPVGSTNKTTSAGTFPSDPNAGYQIKLTASTGYYFNTSYLMLGKSGSTLELPAFNFDVEKIEVVGNSGASASVKMNLYVGSEAVSTETTGSKGTNTYKINSNFQAAGNVYTLKVTNAYNAQITKIVIYKKDTSHTHTFNNEVWSSDASSHWHAATCGCTDQFSDKAAHTYENGGTTCSVCGYVRTISPISTALAAADNTPNLTVRGIVTMVDGKNIFIQDSTGGICLFFSTAPSGLSRGDVVVGTGTRDTYNGLPELKNATFEKVTGASETLTAANKDNIGAVTNADICTYVKIAGLEVTGISSDSAPTVTLKDAQENTIQIFKANLPTGVKTGDIVTVTAAVGIYNNLQLRTSEAGDIVITDDHTDTTADVGKTPVTCTENGYTGDTVCNKCGKVVVEGSVITARGYHNYGEWIEVTPATPEADGEKMRACSDCDAVETAPIVFNCTHATKELSGKVEPTCVNAGYSGDTVCSVCHEIVERGHSVEATGEHTYGEWAVTKQPTSAEKGVKTRTCSVCDHKDTAEIDKLVLTSNIHAVGIENSYLTDKIKVNDETFAAFKIGARSAAGSFSVDLPVGCTGIRFYAVSWSTETTKLTAQYGTTTKEFDLTGAGISNISPYTFTGTLEDHFYEITFDAALTEATKLTLSAPKRAVFFGVNTVGAVYVDENPFQKPTTEAGIVEEAFKLENGAVLPQGPYTLTGVVEKIVSEFNAGAGVTVNFKVAGKTIQCYHLKGTDAEKVAVGDTITVTGEIKNYNGTVEFDNPTLDKRVAGENNPGENNPGENNPGGNDPVINNSQTEIVDKLYQLGADEKLENQTLTGTITKIDTAYSEQYKNITVTIVIKGREDKPVMCYRLKGEGANALKVGDVITVNGTLTNYRGNTFEFTSGCSFTLGPSGTGDESPVVLFGVLMALSAAAAAAVVAGKKRFHI